MTVFVNDNWELDTKTGVISTNTPSGKKAIAEVFGATDFNTDNEQAMAHAKLIKNAPKMYGTLQSLTFLWKNFLNLVSQSEEINSLMDFAEKIINDVAEQETKS